MGNAPAFHYYLCEKFGRYGSGRVASRGLLNEGLKLALPEVKEALGLAGNHYGRAVYCTVLISARENFLSGATNRFDKLTRK